MTNISLQQDNENRFVLHSVIISLCFVLFAFYIDEGYYNFNWMAKVGNWFAFMLYFTSLLLMQVAVYKISKRIHLKPLPNIVSHGIGVILGFMLLFEVL